MSTADTHSDQRGPAPDTSEFIISRTFDAPRERVYQAWTNAERIKQWWGPKGFKTPYCTLDLRPGGICHYRLEDQSGTQMWGKLTYREVAPPERLIFITSFSDERGGATRHPLMPDWPRDMLTVVEFAESRDQTTITIQWIPESPTEPERQTFAGSHDAMQAGWTGTLDQLAEYLTKG